MGTNYYMQRNGCPHCGRGEEELHIGKSSGGWAFSLNTHPGDGIETIDDWRAAWRGGSIRDEYGQSITPEEMERIVTERTPFSDRPLRRHTPGIGTCVRQGDGTFDYMEGEFS